jgi:hypothetical protein
MEPGHPGVDLGSLSISEQIPAHCVFGLIEAPVSGAFVVVTAMLETTDFFQDQVKQCRKLAADAYDKNDREFWLRLAHRWEGLLRAQQHNGPGVETVQKLRFERPIFAKRRRAA